MGDPALKIEPVAVTYDTAAAMLEVSRNTIDRLVADKVLPVTYIRRCPRIPVAALHQLVESELPQAYDKGADKGADLAPVKGGQQWGKEAQPATGKASSSKGRGRQKSGRSTTTPRGSAAADRLAQRTGKKPGRS